MEVQEIADKYTGSTMEVGLTYLGARTTIVKSSRPVSRLEILDNQPFKLIEGKALENLDAAIQLEKGGVNVNTRIGTNQGFDSGFVFGEELSGAAPKNVFVRIEVASGPEAWPTAVAR